MPASDENPATGGQAHDAARPDAVPDEIWLDRAARLCAAAIAERLLSGLDAVWMPPPTIATEALLAVGYDQAFPQLLAHVHPHLADSPDDHPGPVTSLCPAACYHVYPLYARQGLPVGGHQDVLAWCYRHEEAVGGFRRKHFRMLERVCVADQPILEEWLSGYRTTVVELFARFGLEVEPRAASDPFFGGAGRLMASSQLRQGLKTEFVHELDGREIALASLNNHATHLVSAFGLADGADLPHSGCLAFGLERVALAVWHAAGRREGAALRVLSGLAAAGATAL